MMILSALLFLPAVAAFSAVSPAGLPKSSLLMSLTVAETQPKYTNGVAVPKTYAPTPGTDSITKFENDMAKILAARNGTDLTLPG